MKCNYKLFVLLISFCSFLHSATAQTFGNLKPLTGYSLNVFYSNGFEERAQDIAARSHAAIDYHAALLGFKPSVTLLVLSKEDWSKHTTFPVYGMPHYKNDKTLIVATSDNELWKSFIPPLEQLPSSLADQIRKVYKTKDETVSMQPFFDLLALHELGHAFHIQGGLHMLRKWMGELFCNLFLHTYIAEKEPHQLPALELFPQMVVTTSVKGFSFTSLEEFENNYNLIAQSHPKNYGWYQSRLHMAAKNIYDAGGRQVLVKLWHVLKEKRTLPDHQEFAGLLINQVHTSVADVIRNW